MAIAVEMGQIITTKTRMGAIHMGELEILFTILYYKNRRISMYAQWFPFSLFFPLF